MSVWSFIKKIWSYDLCDGCGWTTDKVYTGTLPGIEHPQRLCQTCLTNKSNIMKDMKMTKKLEKADLKQAKKAAKMKVKNAKMK